MSAYSLPAHDVNNRCRCCVKKAGGESGGGDFQEVSGSAEPVLPAIDMER
jgi:hypothetical protein